MTREPAEDPRVRPAPFPRELLGALRAAAPVDAVLRLGLWGGEVIPLARVVREEAEGLVGEVEGEGRDAAHGPVLVAVPWHALARVEAVPPKPRARPGFVPPHA
jgi:hypothetical protein